MMSEKIFYEIIKIRITAKWKENLNSKSICGIGITIVHPDRGNKIMT